MSKQRLETFSDSVLAIFMTILVLDLRVPQLADLSVLRSLAPSFLSWSLSFVFLGIYWNNHHHLLHAAESINGAVLWANLHLLFWLSLVPFTTAWLGQTEFAPVPTALYGLVFLLAAGAYIILQRSIIAVQGHESRLALAVGKDAKGELSILLYMAGVSIALVHPWIANSLYLTVALLWLVPDPRIERLRF